jgi:serine/threonine protein kinase
MGCATSAMTGGDILDKPDGDKVAYETRFVEDRVLGEGEFGQVKLVYETTNSDGQEKPKKMYASKTLRKGPVFKDNTLYPPMPADILQGEIDMLRTLNGEHYNMKLIGVYETPWAILMVTEFYSGGEMLEYVSKQPEDLRTEDVSRIAFELLSAINHCAKNNIIHRDIKPENTMFVSPEPGAELRLIDYGSGTKRVVEGMHTTFAGTAFYNSPEMFQKAYTSKTDVFSCGVLFYVLVAGYPSECLQKAFNILLDSKRTSLKSLPNLPEDMPESYYELLDECLKYRHKARKSAGEIIETCDFVKFHKDLAAEEAVEEGDEFPQEVLPPQKSASARKSRMEKTASFAIRGSVERHSAFVDFKVFERSLTAVLAAMLSKTELVKVLAILDERHGASASTNPHLQVISIKELKDILNIEIDNEAW